MIGNAALLQARKRIQDFAPARAAQQLPAQFGPRSMHGNVQGRSAAPDDAVELAPVHVGERDKIAHDQRLPPIVILHAHAFPHVRRQLIHKAKRAMVHAQAHAIRFQPNAQRLVFFLIKGKIAPRRR